MSQLLPLFPLDVVLFPGVPLPLHIFEPRYKEMISECLESNQVFGVLRAKAEGIAEIGCTADIVGVTKKYPDGRMDIVTEGRRRFELIEVKEDRSFLQGEVFYLEDEPGLATADEIQRVTNLHNDILRLAEAEPLGAGEADTNSLSFRLAGSLPLDLDFKQTLLAINSEAIRIRTLITCFETILPNLRRAVITRQKSGGNGHVH